MSEPGGTRIGDAERQAVVDLLRRHTGEGRLTLDEFADLVGDVYEAQTRDDLDAVVDKLPEGVRPPPSGLPAPAMTTDETALGERPRRRRFIAIMSGSHARGRWRASPRMSAFAFWGGVHLDLRNALIDSPVVEIRAWAVMGGVTITVPPGIPVELDGCVLMGGSHNAVRAQDPIPGAPLVRVRCRGMWGGVTVRNPGQRSHHHDRHAHRHEVRDRAHQYADDALDIARTAVERALPRSTGGHVPPMPSTDHAPAEATKAASSPAPRPAGPPAPAKPSTNGSVPTGTLTMLVSDIAGSTQMAERLGDQAWIELLGAHNEVVRAQVAEHGGTEVKAQGDGFLVVFPSARAAVLAAIAIQEAIHDHSARRPAPPVELRVGLHTGEVAVVDDDVFGQNVVVACRITEAAEPGEIVVSGLTRDLAASASDLDFDDGTDVTLKGLSQPWRVHRVVWNRT
jgi:class 3 adenylate cyclase